MANNISLCSICYDSIEGTQFIVKEKLAFEGDNSLDAEKMSAIQTKCNHIFHESCLAKWIIEYKAKTSPPLCPNCRAPLMETGGISSHPVNLTDTPNHITLAALNALMGPISTFPSLSLTALNALMSHNPDPITLPNSTPAPNIPSQHIVLSGGWIVIPRTNS